MLPTWVTSHVARFPRALSHTQRKENQLAPNHRISPNNNILIIYLTSFRTVTSQARDDYDRHMIHLAEPIVYGHP